MVARIAVPEAPTGVEAARAVGGVDLDTDPLAWLTGPAGDWRWMPGSRSASPAETARTEGGRAPGPAGAQPVSGHTRRAGSRTETLTSPTVRVQVEVAGPYQHVLALTRARPAGACYPW
jgi:hypothetical protein